MNLNPFKRKPDPPRPVLVCPNHGTLDGYRETHSVYRMDGTVRMYCVYCMEDQLAATGCGPIESNVLTDKSAMPEAEAIAAHDVKWARQMEDFLRRAADDEAARLERAVAAEREKVEQEVAGVLREVAAVVHSGGLVGMTEAVAIVAVRKLTLPYWSRSTREDELTLLRGGYKEDRL